MRRPALAQWHNRDLGYGLCGRCAAWIRGRTEFYDPDEFLRCYGEEGIHWMPLARRVADLPGREADPHGR